LATLVQATKFIARVSFRYEFDLAAVRPDPPQLPSLRSFALDFPSRLFVVIHCRLRFLGFGAAPRATDPAQKGKTRCLGRAG
jgi:hypothetical protein